VTASKRAGKSIEDGEHEEDSLQESKPNPKLDFPKRTSFAAKLQQVAQNNIAASPALAGTSKDNSSVFLLGYHVRPVDSESCTVTCISSLSPDLRSLETDIASCRKLKQFIEDLAHLTDENEGGRRGSNPSVGDDGRSMEKIKTLFGTTANFLYKASAMKAKELLANSQRTAEGSPLSGSSSTSLQPPNLDFILPTGDTAESATEVIADPLQYIDRMVGPREVQKIVIPFDSKLYTAVHVDFMSRSDHSPFFGMMFTPSEPFDSNLLPASNGTFVLLPLVAVQSTTRPVHTTIPLSLLPSGTITVIFDNLSPLLTRNRPKSITYKAYCEEQSHGEYSIALTISRLQVYTLPIILKNSKLTTISFESQVEIPFSIIFHPVGEEKKIILPPTKLTSLSNTKFETLETADWEGTLSLSWDNSASMISSRNISFHILVAY
jgi:hypothetical protein